jgi:hypothetical protein
MKCDAFFSSEFFEALAFLGLHFLFVKCDASFFVRGLLSLLRFLELCFLFVKCDVSFLSEVFLF